MNVRILAFFAALVVFVAAAYLELKPTSPADLAPEKPRAAAASPEKVPLSPRSALASRTVPPPMRRAASAAQPPAHPTPRPRPGSTWKEAQ